MAKLDPTSSPAQRLDRAVQTTSPGRLAQTFAAFIGQFYDRTDFDALARQARDRYQAQGSDDAYRFQATLDRRLYDRYHAPVAWDVTPTSADQAA